MRNALRARLRVHARWAGRRLRTVHRAPDDTERDCAARHDRHAAPAITQGRGPRRCFLPRLLQGLRQVCDHFLRGRQLLGDRFLGSSDFPGQPALSVPTADLRRGRLRRVDPKPDNATCDIHRPHGRVRQASAQPLPRGQLGPAFAFICRLSMLAGASSACHLCDVRGNCVLLGCFGYPATPAGPGAGGPARNGRL